MKTYNHLFQSLEHLNDFLEDIEVNKNHKVLVRLHSSIHTIDMIGQIAGYIKESVPDAVIIGCSTSQIICEGKIIQDGCLISVSLFENCEIRLGMFDCEGEDGKDKNGEILSREVSEELVKGDSGLMLVFFPLSYYKTAKFVESMNRLNNGLKMIGGVSYVADSVHSEAEAKAYVLAQTDVSTGCMAAVMLVSPELSVYENVICGVESAGRSYEVTKVHEHYLDEIEGIDAAKWYEEMLGKEELEKDPSLAGIFPLVQEGSKIAYNVIYEPCDTLPEPWKTEERDRINLFSEISAGMKFSLGYFAPQKIVDQMNAAYVEMKNEPIESLFTYDCLSRMWMLHDCAKWEIGQFYTTNMSGAMLAGEISNINGKNMYANSTFVIAGLSEHKDARIMLKGKGLKDVSALQHENVQMINYLLMTGNRQLSAQLNEQQDKMKKAMFYQTALGLDNQTKYIFDHERMNLDKVAVFSIKNERMLRLFMGQDDFLSELKHIYESIRERFSREHLHFYSFKDYSLLASAESSVADEDFIGTMKRIFEDLKDIRYKDFVFSYECAVVIGEEEALQKAESTLEYGIKNKKNFVIYSQIPEEIISAKEEMHILQVVREALVQDRVVPYFQGIHDNRTGKIQMYEALIRIQDAQGNLYYPNQFLSIAKEYDLYELLSNIMVKKVMCMFLDKDVKVTINLNVRDIYDRDMIRMIFQYLKKAAHPENFVFELLESEEIRDYQFIEQFADSVHEYGAKIAIDDFGSGFSNLLHIIKINADILKIDGEIIKVVCEDDNCREFVTLINEWCKRKGKEVVAEFVENERIQQVMDKIGIAYSQGYHFARPEKWV